MNNDINVEQIMSDIRENISKTGRDKEPLSFIDKEAALDAKPNDNSIDNAVDYISYNYEVKPYDILRGNKIAVFFKRVIRKLTSFLIMPIVAQQNTLNYYYYRVSEAVLSAKKDNEELIKRADLLEKRIAAIESKLGDKKD
ncbi:MAG: hypothetical protein MJ166_07325 [Clostridia bacterium]|nr:hypothetical protein [Clostridia bacterium]